MLENLSWDRSHLIYSDLLCRLSSDTVSLFQTVLLRKMTQTLQIPSDSVSQHILFRALLPRKVPPNDSVINTD